MCPYFIWHCSLPYYQANTGYWKRYFNSTTTAYKLCNEQMANLVRVACIDLASATFRRTHQLAVFVSKRFLQTGPNSPV